MMKYLFWILWSSELAVMLWWLFDEMKLRYLPMNAMVPFGFLWLGAALFIKLGIKSDKYALIMVGIPGVPLAIMALFLLLIFIINIVAGPIKWN